MVKVGPLALKEWLEKQRFKHRASYNKAQGLYRNGHCTVQTINTREANLTVKSEHYQNFYDVTFTDYQQEATIKFTCDCPAPKPCKHTIAAAMALIEHLNNKGVEEAPTADVPDSESLASMATPQPAIRALKQLTIPIPHKLVGLLHSNSKVLNSAHQIANKGGVYIQQAGDSQVVARVADNKSVYTTRLTIDLTAGDLTMSCTCGDYAYTSCPHMMALLIALFRKYEQPFIELADLTDAKNKMLKPWGYTATDPEADALFKVIIDEDHQPKVIPKDKSLEKRAAHAQWAERLGAVHATKLPLYTVPGANANQRTVFVWRRHTMRQYNVDLPVRLARGKTKKNGGLGGPLTMLSWAYSSEVPLDNPIVKKVKRVFDVLEEGGHPDINKALQRADNHAYTDHEYLDLFALHVMDVGYSLLVPLWPELANDEHYFTKSKEYPPKITELTRTTLALEPPQLRLTLKEEQNHLVLAPELVIDQTSFAFDEVAQLYTGFVYVTPLNQLYCLSRRDANTAMLFDGKTAMRVHTTDTEQFLATVVAPLLQYHPIDIAPSIDLNMAQTNLELNQVRVYLKEMGNHLLLVPAFHYLHGTAIDTETEMDGGRFLVVSEAGKLHRYARDVAAEEAARDQLMGLHPTFGTQRFKHFFNIDIKEAMASNWFFDAFAAMQAAGYEVLGSTELTKIKYNPHRPTTQLRVSSGQDWFDLHIVVTFGKQKVGIAEIRKALFNRQSYVQLGDGTIGVLPKEWLERYSHLFKLSKADKKALRFSQFQASALDEIEDEVENMRALQALREKLAKLRNFKGVAEVDPPGNMHATLRQYQQEGYNWLHFLHSYGWGGCLADDMGLGKTVQVLAFIQSVVNRQPEATFLVVVPRSLVFNWQREAQRFCPELTMYVHWGPDRSQVAIPFAEHHITLATYAMVRNDLELLQEHQFTYAILDESQAIKNPGARVSIAVKQLNSYNRLVMTGTPIENNTFDLYSQMDFLNPGMLGSMEQFKQQYATRIDRDRDESSAARLNKVIKPFLVRRRKEEVAKELPPKTETVVWCEMTARQRKTYNHYKDKFRKEILDTIKQDGLSKAGMLILQGLMRLRQACLSTALLTDEGDFGQESAKMEALLEELETVIGRGEKALVFSSFKSMLHLVAERLQAQGVGYSMLTGDTSNREAVVNEFKQEPDKQVFLITLKAGGFGLNLTEASYVFLIDPWWNPAAENQAIDRTHRIGQDKQVFAYKLVCRDTIEEKILAIQERKKAVSDDVINTEAAFIQQMDQNDITALFD